jgi:hypothetical protein
MQGPDFTAMKHFLREAVFWGVHFFKKNKPTRCAMALMGLELKHKRDASSS